MIDARTRAARPVYGPYLALVGVDRLALDLLGRDADGVARRFVLAIPTEGGGYPTLVGRLCAVLQRDCAEGLIDYSLGPASAYVSFADVRAAADTQALERWFRDRIVLIGTTRRDTDRIAVPDTPARWEQGAADAPAIAVHAQALRTALSGTAPRPLSRPAVVMVVGAAALLAGLRRRSSRLVGAACALAALAIGGAFLLRTGIFIPVAAPALVLFGVMVLAAFPEPSTAKGHR